MLRLSLLRLDEACEWRSQVALRHDQRLLENLLKLKLGLAYLGSFVADAGLSG